MRSDNDRLKKLEASRAEMRKTMGEMKASLAEISRWLWKKQMGEIKANLAMVSKAIGLLPIEGQSTTTPQQEGVPTTTSPTTALTCNSTQNRDDLGAGKNKIFKEQSVEDLPSRLGNTKSKIAPQLDSNSVLSAILEMDEEGDDMTADVHKVIENKELTTQNIEIEKLAPENQELAAIPANVRQDLAAIKHEWQSVHTNIADAVPKQTWVERDDDEPKVGELYEESIFIESGEPKSVPGHQEIKEVDDVMDEAILADSSSGRGNDGMNLGSLEAGKRFIEELEQESGGDTHSGLDNGQSQGINDQVEANSKEEDEIDDEGDGKELNDSTALNVVLKFATCPDPGGGGNGTITSHDGSMFFLLEDLEYGMRMKSVSNVPVCVAGGDSNKCQYEDSPLPVGSTLTSFSSPPVSQSSYNIVPLLKTIELAEQKVQVIDARLLNYTDPLKRVRVEDNGAGYNFSLVIIFVASQSESITLQTSIEKRVISAPDIKSNRDLSVVLEALLKSKSQTVHAYIINKNGLQIMHNIRERYGKEFSKTPILLTLLKVRNFNHEDKVVL